MIRTLFFAAALCSMVAATAQKEGFQKYQPGTRKAESEKAQRRSAAAFLPELERQYQWNLINADWDSTQVLRYVYSNGNLDTVLITDPVNNAPIARRIHTKTAQLDEIVTQNFNGTTYENASRQQTFFNQFGYRIGEEYQSWVNNAWVLDGGEKIVLEYTPENQISAATFQYWNPEFSSWESEVKYIVGWMPDGRFDGYTIQVPSEDGTLEDYVRINAEYSAAAVEADTLYVQVLFLGEWFDAARYIVSRWADYDDVLMAQPVTYIEQSDMGGGFTDTGRQTRLDLPNGGYTDTYEELNENQTWSVSYVDEVAFDDNGNMLYMRGYEFGSGEQMVTYWDNYLYTYDAQNRLTERIVQMYNMDEQTLVNDSRSVYPQFLDVTSVSSARAAAVKAYPNPSSGIIQIEGLKAGTQARVFNLLGAEVIRFSAVSGSNTIDLSQLPSGVYILEAAGKTHRLVKQ